MGFLKKWFGKKQPGPSGGDQAPYNADPPAPATTTAERAGVTTYGKVIIVGESSALPIVMQAEQKLLRLTAEKPHYPLTPEAEFAIERVSALPAAERAAVEPFVWVLQTRHNRRGGAWQVDFFNPLGFAFMVVYLE